MAINPLDNPKAYNEFRAGGLVWPLVVITGFTRPHEWDQKKGKGGLGATITFVQRPAAKGKVKFYLWEPAHWDLWDQFVPQLKYDPTKKAPSPVDVYNPKLARLDINSIVTENIGQEDDEGNKFFSITVDMLEYFAVPNASSVSTPNSSKSGFSTGNSNGAQPDPAGDAQQKQIATLLEEAKKP